MSNDNDAPQSGPDSQPSAPAPSAPEPSSPAPATPQSPILFTPTDGDLGKFSAPPPSRVSTTRPGGDD